MSHSSSAVRVRRSQKFLRDAMIDLIEEQGFDTLSVGEITERAMVGRATFYRHYQDKYDLVEQIFAEAMRALFDAISEPDTVHSPQLWVRFFEHIAEYERLYRALLGRKGSPWFVFKMRASLIDLIKGLGNLSIIERSIYPSSDEFIPNLLATMLVEAIAWWLEQGKPYSPKEIANRCILLTAAIFKETSTWQDVSQFSIVV